jgi:hypothetical protein
MKLFLLHNGNDVRFQTHNNYERFFSEKLLLIIDFSLSSSLFRKIIEKRKSLLFLLFLLILFLKYEIPPPLSHSLSIPL